MRVAKLSRREKFFYTPRAEYMELESARWRCQWTDEMTLMNVMDPVRQDI